MQTMKHRNRNRVKVTLSEWDRKTLGQKTLWTTLPDPIWEGAYSDRYAIRAGEFIPASILPNPLITLGVIDPLHLRVDIDESEIPRFSPTAKAFASVRGRPEVQVPIEYVRTEPLVIPKRSLTGSVSERVDTRVMQVIYSVDPNVLGAAVGQQVDVYIVEENGAP